MFSIRQISFIKCLAKKLKRNKTLKRKLQFVVLLTIVKQVFHFTFLWKKESFEGNEMRDLV